VPPFRFFRRNEGCTMLMAGVVVMLTMMGFAIGGLFTDTGEDDAEGGRDAPAPGDDPADSQPIPSLSALLLHEWTTLTQSTPSGLLNAQVKLLPQRRFAYVGFLSEGQADAALSYFHDTFIDTSKVEVRAQGSVQPGLWPSISSRIPPAYACVGVVCSPRGRPTAPAAMEQALGGLLCLQREKRLLPLQAFSRHPGFLRSALQGASRNTPVALPPLPPPCPCQEARRKLVQKLALATNGPPPQDRTKKRTVCCGPPAPASVARHARTSMRAGAGKRQRRRERKAGHPAGQAARPLADAQAGNGAPTLPPLPRTEPLCERIPPAAGTGWDATPFPMSLQTETDPSQNPELAEFLEV
jgi:hypothetical protein